MTVHEITDFKEQLNQLRHENQELKNRLAVVLYQDTPAAVMEHTSGKDRSLLNLTLRVNTEVLIFEIGHGTVLYLSWSVYL